MVVGSQDLVADAFELSFYKSPCCQTTKSTLACGLDWNGAYPRPQLFLAHDPQYVCTIHYARPTYASRPRNLGGPEAMKHTNTPMTAAELANVRRCQMTFEESRSPWPTRADREGYG